MFLQKLLELQDTITVFFSPYNPGDIVIATANLLIALVLIFSIYLLLFGCVGYMTVEGESEERLDARAKLIAGGWGVVLAVSAALVVKFFLSQFLSSGIVELSF